MARLQVLEELVDAAVTAAELESGVPARIAARRSRLDLPEVQAAFDVQTKNPDPGRPNLGRWTPEEETFVRSHLGCMSLEEIGEATGRTAAAIKVRFTRKGWPAPSKQPGDLVAREVAWRLGKCGKSVKALIEAGILPGRRIPGKGEIHVVKEVTFYRWAVNPDNWIYFKHERVRDRKLRRLLAMKRKRWDDEWLTTGQVARLRRLPGGSNDVTRHIYTGKLPAVKYQFWRVRRSVAEGYRFSRGRGSSSGLDWSEEADAFLILCTAIGLPQKSIAALMKWPRWRPGYRLGLLMGKGRIQQLSDRFALDVRMRGPSGGAALLFADWRNHLSRFPCLRRSVSRLVRGRPLNSEDIGCLRGVLRSWARWYAENNRHWRRLAGSLRGGSRNGEARIRKVWREMQAWGVDPFEIE
jgi:hypothetical protein